MPREKRVNITQVANEAGVSKQTVSRVVNKSPHVSEATRHSVLQAIDLLGYRPSSIARGFTQGRSFTLGVIGANLSLLGTELYLGMAIQAEMLGYTLILKKLTQLNKEHVENTLFSLLDQQVEGILWAIPDSGQNTEWLDAKTLAHITVPIVFLSSEPREQIISVGFDNHECGKLATQLLIQSGRKYIAHISGPRHWWVARERIRGWKAALNLASLNTSETMQVEGNWSPQSGEKALMQLLDSQQKMDAVFVASDRMALGALLTAHRHGIRVPQELAIIGVDNIIESACFYPPLTTVQQDKRHHGEVTVSTLVKHIENRADEHKANGQVPVLPHQIIIREST